MSRPFSEKYAVDDGRHRQNPYAEYPPGAAKLLIDTDNIHIYKAFKHTLTNKVKNLLEELQRNEREWYNRGDCSIYTGNAGIALMYRLLGQKFNQPSHTSRALELIEKSLRDGKDCNRDSFLAGISGPLALGAVFYKEAGNEAEFQKMISQLCSSSKRALTQKSDELLYGKVGYLYALLFVNANVPSRPIDKELIVQVIEKILKSGRDYAATHRYETPLMYEWHEKEYLGGAHGLAGILYVLLQAREYLTDAQLREDIEPALKYLEKLRFSSGNFPSSMGNRNDKLVHWCHGAPAMTMLFALAHRVYRDESFLKTAIDCGEVVWTRGLLKKGYSLCHGVSGNAYTFITLYQETEDPKHLCRACKFAEYCMSYNDNCERTPDRPYSLFEGLAGVIYFLVDLFEPKSAKFPAYDL